MKKLFILLAIIGLLASCHEAHISYPLVVKEVSSDFTKCDQISSKYRLSVQTNHLGDEVYIYTDKMFNIGDTIK